MLHPRFTIRKVALAMLAFAALAANAEEATIDAVWKTQRAAFVYTAYTVHYTCYSLERKLKLVLLELGAHEDMVVDASQCSDAGLARLDVSFRSPVLASAENLRMITADDARRRLVARLNGRKDAPFADPARFPAIWQEVSFARNRTLKLDAGDCEFVEHVRRQLLPLLETRVLTNRVMCAPGHLDIGPPRLTVLVLLAAENDMARNATLPR